jgi:hypothetical protein
MIASLFLLLTAAQPQPEVEGVVITPLPPPTRPLADNVPERRTEYGDWTVEEFNGISEAYVKNIYEDVLSYVCDKNCIMYMIRLPHCEDGKTYQATIYTRLGRHLVDMQCKKIGNARLYIAATTPDQLKALKSGDEVTFELPLIRGLTENRTTFSLNGAGPAIEIVLEGHRKLAAAGK